MEFYLKLKKRKVFLLTLLLNFIFFIILYLLFPNVESSLVEEDLFMENLSAALFLLAGCYALFFIITGRSVIRGEVLLITACLDFLFFLEEVGYGGRFLGIPMPEIGGGEVDGVHDIFVQLILSHRTFLRFI